MDTTSDDVELDYAYLSHEALRGVVKDVLELTIELGHPPGEHHFYIEFATGAAGVQLSDALRAQYPDRMVIVLQHQFEGLEVHDDRFEVLLHFGGVPDHLVIPFPAMTRFTDPFAKFEIHFPPPEGDVLAQPPVADQSASDSPQEEAEVTDLPPRQQAEKPGSDDGNKPSGGGADVVSLDRFRKK